MRRGGIAVDGHFFHPKASVYIIRVFIGRAAARRSEKGKTVRRNPLCFTYDNIILSFFV